ncbi:hypothetical protein TPA4_57 [Tsukamurella phage TPA4]|uniref:hypothetical protein n=1 Tax=Tsukamurella phage TPA4 TaxID=1647476 RepID=UPI0007B62C15|nr:hypothetical protein BH784_gp57 [Tsukamurella phage TPA4]AKJ72222.1 hypothetical protein TPA4_57 [Tsukamurella phage TPA4]
MRILITGSRDWSDRDTIRTALGETAHTAWLERGEAMSDHTVVHGACPYGGADTIAAEVAVLLGMKVEAHPADWATSGKAAGPIRNQRMVDLGADVCLAFPLRGSRGTWDCVRRAQEARIPVAIYEPSEVTP